MLIRGRGRKISRALSARLAVPEFTVGKLATMVATVVPGLTLALTLTLD